MTLLLGVTATPNRGDELPLIDLFDNFYQITTKFLIGAGYLVRPTFVDLSPTFTFTKGKKTITEKGRLNKNVDLSDSYSKGIIDIFILRYQERFGVTLTDNAISGRKMVLNKLDRFSREMGVTVL